MIAIRCYKHNKDDLGSSNCQRFTKIGQLKELVNVTIRINANGEQIL